MGESTLAATGRRSAWRGTARRNTHSAAPTASGISTAIISAPASRWFCEAGVVQGVRGADQERRDDGAAERADQQVGELLPRRHRLQRGQRSQDVEPEQQPVQGEQQVAERVQHR